MNVREPAVAGMFYPSGDNGLKEMVEMCFLGPLGPGKLPTVDPNGPRNIIGLVSPHAGLVYSGSVAAWAYSRLAEDGLPDIAVIIGPNHRSYHPLVSISNSREWVTPMGRVEVDLETAENIAGAWDEAELDQRAHHAEHSLEVQLPFLQYISKAGGKDISIVPILIAATDAALEVAHSLGGAIVKALQGKNAVIIASTDFTHYESGESAQAKDTKAIEAILSLDEKRLLDTVREFRITMCGYLPTATMITASKDLGAKSAKKLAYHNSGDVTGDYREVVAYGAIEIDR